ncbi:MAG: NusG domain II-containing protein [Tissierellia bacterium]|nr:NusG domain II-containing protein [Tissierellia bacterium]
MTRGDKILIAIIIIVNVAALFFVKNLAFNYENKYISIQVNGEEIKKITFDSNMVGKQIPIETEYGYNLIEIGDEKVRVIEADCPDQLDVKQGYISRVGEVIVCLPNKLVIEIKGGNIETDIDGLSR